MLALQPSMKPETQEGASLKELLKDPYILVAAGTFNLCQLWNDIVHLFYCIHLMLEYSFIKH